ncbi:MAG: radical SAM protein [Chloroflexota bacterium]
MSKTSELYFITHTACRSMLETSDCDCNCDCDCDCACPSVLEAEESPYRAFAQDATLFPSANVQCYALDAQNWIVLGGSSSPAVMSAACYDLFRRFPARAYEAVEQMQARWSAGHIHEAIAQMVEHGLLSDKPNTASCPDEVPSTVLASWIHLTSQCNLACRYCYLPHKTEMLAPALGRAVVDAILHAACAHGYSTIKLKYAGGEPLLNFPVLVDNFGYATAQAQKAGLALEGRILTNGLLLDHETVSQIKAHGLSLTVSLDGIGAWHDTQRPLRGGGSSFALVERGISLAMEAGLQPGISVTLSGANAGGLPELVAWLLDRDLRFTFNFYRPNPLSQGQAALDFENRQIIDALRQSYALIESRRPGFAFWYALADRVNLRQPHTRPCSAGRSYLVFDVHGNLAGCQMAIDATMGSYRTADPLAAIQSASSGPQNAPVTQKAACAGCEWRWWCAGGCPALAKYATGSDTAASPYCAIYKEIIPLLLHMEARSLLTRRGQNAGRKTDAADAATAAL